MNFSFETQGPVTYLSCELDANEPVDSLTLGMLTNNRIVGMAPVLYSELDGRRFLKYNVSAKIPVSQFFAGTVTRQRCLSVLKNILDTVCSADDYMIMQSCFEFNPDYMFVNVSSCEVSLVCIPVNNSNDANEEIKKLVKRLVSNGPDGGIDDGYTGKILSYIDNDPSFNVYSLNEIVKSLEGPAVSAGGMGMQGGMPAQNSFGGSGSFGQPAAGGFGGMGQMGGAMPKPAAPTPPQPPVMPSAPVQQNSGMGGFGGMGQMGGAMPRPAAPTPPQPPVMPSAPVQQNSGMGGFGGMNQMGGAMPRPAAPTPPQPPVMPSAPSMPKIPGAPVQRGGIAIPSAQGGIAVPGAQPKADGKKEKPKKEKKEKVKKEKPAKKEKSKKDEAPAKAADNGEKISVFDLMMHYNKENVEKFKAQKNAEKSQKSAGKAAAPNQPAVPGRPAQPQVPGAFGGAPAFRPMGGAPVPPMAPPAQQNPGMGGFGGGMSGSGAMPVNNQFTSTVVLDNSIGETTVLSPAPAPGEPYLTRMKNSERIIINKPVFRIGKERSYVDYFVSDNTAISRSHANIIKEDDAFYIEDTNSTNHTYLNGAMLTANTRVKLSDGDRIRLANEDFTFSC